MLEFQSFCRLEQESVVNSVAKVYTTRVRCVAKILTERADRVAKIRTKAGGWGDKTTEREACGKNDTHRMISIGHPVLRTKSRGKTKN